MPRTLLQETERPLWAFCPHGHCPGYVQEEVPGVVREVGDTFVAGGGDIPGIERSQVEYLFVSEDDRACPSCGRARQLSPEPRPSYDPLSGHDPGFLLNGPGFDPSKVNSPADEAMAEQLAEMRRELAELKKKAEDAG